MDVRAPVIDRAIRGSLGARDVAEVRGVFTVPGVAHGLMALTLVRCLLGEIGTWVRGGV
jgi:hypothetical protein